MAERRLFEDVADTIRRLILDGTYPPGTRLPGERELSERFEVSRVTIREAEIALQATGWIHIRTGAGAIESEVMLRLRAVPDERVTADNGARWVDEIRAGFEVASSPAPDVHDHAPYGIVADIGINNGLLLGPRLEIGDFATLSVETQIDGVPVGAGRPIDVLDGPWGSLDFLADLHHRGVIELKPGQWISAGAITGVHPIAIGQTAAARFGSAAVITCVAAAETGFNA